VWSCLVDDTPAIRRDFPIWLATLTRLAGVMPGDIVVHHVCDLPARLDRMLDDLSVRRHRVAPFDARTPPANKIAQCHTDFGSAEYVVLTDVDLLFVRPLPVDEVPGRFAAKLVDSANPAIERLHRFFADAGLRPPAAVSTTQYLPAGPHTFETLPVNLNGGLYVVERELLAPLGDAWEAHARRLLERSDLQPAEFFHCDQIAMALALTELEVDVELLPESWNFPGHFGRPLEPPLPMAVHHHGRLDHNLRALEAGAPGEASAARRAIVEFESRLASPAEP